MRRDPPLAGYDARAAGGGRRARNETDPALLDDLRRLVEPATMGDPMRPLLWVSKSWAKLATALRELNHRVSANTVGKMLLTPGILHPNADRIMITADGGGSNGSRVRLWKLELQKLADETGLALQVCHYPPGTSKWNTIEHRMFCHITQTWRGKPLVSRLAVVELIAATTTRTGLTVQCELDENAYAKAIKVTDAKWPRSRSPPMHGTQSATTPSG